MLSKQVKSLASRLIFFTYFVSIAISRLRQIKVNGFPEEMPVFLDYDEVK